VPLAVGAIFVLYSRVAKEGTMMIDLFGDEYQAYMQLTGRFLPHL
jgi:protein-S-isoprenylcysteine O-methyltransferase Ste14